MATETRLALGKVYVSRSCICAGGCWRAKCHRCGKVVTKHDFTAAAALDALEHHDNEAHPRRTQGREIIERYVGAGVCVSGTLTSCCRSRHAACLFDVWHDDDHVEALVVMAYALQRAEGRAGDPPFKCPTCNVLTFGGCHPPDGEEAVDETPEGLPCASPLERPARIEANQGDE